MYRNCIFCSAALGSNDSIERFPVGRSLAFDAAKGRLWAVCPRCARWNLAPIEERWEAVEDAERLFRDTRTRAQHENIGLAKLRDGTRLVRVGQALPRELFAWRYGETMDRRWRRTNRLALAGVGLAMGAGAPITAGLVVPALAMLGAGAAAVLASGALGDAFPTGAWGSRIVHRARGPESEPVPVRAAQLARARLRRKGVSVALEVPSGVRSGPGARGSGSPPLVLRGNEALAALGRALVLVNRRGGTRGEVERARQEIERAGSPHRLLLRVARRAPLLTGALMPPDARAATQDKAPDPQTMLAVELALHAESERRALEGELAGLLEMWRQAEEIAAIADWLPGPLRWAHGRADEPRGSMVVADRHHPPAP